MYCATHSSINQLFSNFYLLGGRLIKMQIITEAVWDEAQNTVFLRSSGLMETPTPWSAGHTSGCQGLCFSTSFRVGSLGRRRPGSITLLARPQLLADFLHLGRGRVSQKP